MYRRRIRFSYSIVRSIILSMISTYFERSMRMSWFASHCFTSFAINDRTSGVGLFGLYSLRDPSVSKFISGVSLFPKIQAQILYIAFRLAIGL